MLHSADLLEDPNHMVEPLAGCVQRWTGHLHRGVENSDIAPPVLPEEHWGLVAPACRWPRRRQLEGLGSL